MKKTHFYVIQFKTLVLWLGVCLSFSAMASSYTWTGTSSSEWALDANWSGGATYPDDITNDTANFTGSSAPSTISISSGAISANELIFIGSTPYTINNSGTFTIGSGGIDSSGTSSGVHPFINNYDSLLFTNGSGILANYGNFQVFNRGGSTTFGSSSSDSFSIYGGAYIQNNDNGSNIGYMTFNGAATVNYTLIDNYSATGSISFGGGLNTFDTTFNNREGGAFVFSGGSIIGGGVGNINGSMTFNGSTLNAITGGNTIANYNDADLTFSDASIIASTLNNFGTGQITFNLGATLTGSTLSNYSGIVVLNGSSSIGDTTTVNNAATINFNDSSSITSSTINNSGNVNFNGTSAASSAILNTTGGTLSFLNGSTAGSSTITNSGGTIYFGNTATATNATVVSTSGGKVDISQLTSGISIGSLNSDNAASITYLGSKNLTLGAFNTSDTIASAIADGGIAGGTGGSLTKTGTGTLTLTGNNTYTGTTTVSNGHLHIGDGNTAISTLKTSSIDITNNSDLFFNLISSLSYSGNIIGNGTLTKSGAGALTLNGQNVATSTTVNAGSLFIGDGTAQQTAQLTSNVTVGSGATLGGIGIVSGNVTVGNNAYFSPGVNYTGAFNINNGNYTQAASTTYSVDVAQDGSADVLNVNNGTAYLNGGNLVIGVKNGFQNFYAYRILNAEAISGTFGNVDLNGQFTQGYLQGQLFYYGDEAKNASDAPKDATLPSYVELIVDYNTALVSSVWQTPNQMATGNYILQTLGTGAVQNLIASLNSAQPQQLSNAWDQLSGAAYGNENLALAHMGGLFSMVVGDRLSDFNVCLENQSQYEKKGNKTTAQNCQSGKTIWMTAQQGDDQLAPGAVSGLSTTYDVLMLGAEIPVGVNTTFGMGVSYNDFSGKATGGVENATTKGELIQFGLYGRYQYEDWLVSISADVGTTDNFSTQRNIQDVGNLVGVSANRSANVYSEQARLSYDLTPRTGFTLQPFAGFITQQVDASGFNEPGDTGFELTVSDSAYNTARSQLGVTVATPKLSMLTPFATLVWEHEFADTQSDFNAQLSGLGPSSTTFNIVSTPVGRDSAVIDAGVVLYEKQHFNLAAAYEGRFASNWQANAAVLQANVVFE